MKIILEYEEDRCLQLLEFVVDYIKENIETGEDTHRLLYGGIPTWILGVGEDTHEYTVYVYKNKSSYRIIFTK